MAISQYDNEYYGLSGDNKPLGTPLNGRKFTEMDTSKEYRFDAENQQWLQQSPSGGSRTLSGLTDVDISNPTDGQMLVYNAESGKWENGAGGGGGGVGFTLLNGTYSEDGEGRASITLSITASELYALMRTSTVAFDYTQGSESASTTSVVIIDNAEFHVETGVADDYAFTPYSIPFLAQGLAATDTVVFSSAI